MSEPVKPCESPEARQFDFWLGEWDLTWPAEQTGGAEGEIGRGTNRIERLFGDCVVEENFSLPGSDFYGRSLSVYDPQAGMWRQTWVDSQANYLIFAGGYDGQTMELHTPEVERVVQRMVFSNIGQDSLNWDWQGSRDGGETWNDLWNITYQRRS